MSAPHRPFLRRFALALLGMLLLMAVVFAGLGWMVARDFGRVSQALGEKNASRLWHWYLGLMTSLIPGDQDGDGLCDGNEWFCGTDPRSPTTHMPVAARCIYNSGLIVLSGERLSTRWMQAQEFANTAHPAPVKNWHWPQGYRASLSANAPILLARNATGPATSGPLIVVANGRGELEFDLLADGDRALRGATVYFANAQTGGRLNEAYIQLPGWRRPLVEVSIDVVIPGTTEVMSAGMAPNQTLNWMSPPERPNSYVIEASCVDAGATWQAVGVEVSGRSEWLLNERAWQFFPGYNGPLKFRVVPVSSTPP